MDIFAKIEKVFGSPSGLSKVLDTSPQRVSNWKRRGKIPPESCQQIAEASGGKISLHELRPDIYPAP